MVKWTPGEEIILERNDQFAGEPSLLDRIVVRFIPDAIDRILSLSTGEVDLAMDLPEGALIDARQLPCPALTTQRPDKPSIYSRPRTSTSVLP